MTATDDTVATAKASVGAPAPVRRSRWRRRLIVMGLLLAILVVFHEQVFPWLASLLVVEDSQEQTDAVVVGGRSGPYQAVPFDELAELYHGGHANEIVLIEDRSSRLVKANIVPSLETVLRKELAARGVPASAVTALAGESLNHWEGARRLRDWLETHPDSTATILCDEFDSRRTASITRGVLGKEMAARVRWRALRDSRYDGSNWWRSRPGILAFCGAYVALVHTFVAGEPPESRAWDADEYEARLRELQ